MKSSTKEGIRKKKDKKYFMDGHLGTAATLLPPWRTQPSIYESSIQYPSPYVCTRNPSIFSPRSYYIVFCVPDESGEWDDDDDDGKEWGHSKWFTIKIHTDGPGKVCPKPLIPFWQGKTPNGGLGALGTDIYCFGGMTYTESSEKGFRHVYKLRVTPRAAKAWVSVPPMISRRNCPQASALGRKMYVRNSFHYDEPCPHWGEVFDPANEKWEAVPNPPNYPSDYPNRIFICEAVENPDRIIVAYRVPSDRSSAIFYAYNVQHRYWGMLAPRKRKLHRLFVGGHHEDWCQEGAVSANNTLYWIHHTDKFMNRTDEMLLIAYDLDLDVWLEGHVKGIRNLFSLDYQPGYDSDGGRGDGATLPVFLHMEKQRFCLLQREVGENNYLHCVVVDVFHMTEEKTLKISVAWDQKYSMEPKIGCGFFARHTVLSYCDILPK